MNGKERISLREWCIENGRQSLLEEWDYSKNTSVTPDAVTKGSQKRVWWRYKEGHQWESIISNRTNLQRGCPICSNKRTGLSLHQNYISQNTSFAIEYPELASQWHPYKNDNLTAFDVTQGYNKKVW